MKKHRQPKQVKVSQSKILELAEKQYKSPGETRKLALMVQGLVDSLNQKQRSVAAASEKNK